MEDRVLLCGKHKAPFLEDSGSTTTLVSVSFCKEADLIITHYDIPVISDSAVLEGKIPLVGTTTMDVKLGTIAGNVVIRNITAEVTSMEMDEVLLGNDLLRELGIDVREQMADRAGTEYSIFKDVTEEIPDISPTLDFGETNECELREALHQLVEQALENGLPEQYKDKWADLLEEYADVFRLRMGNDPPAKVEPMEFKWDATSQPIRHKSRRFPLMHREFMDRMTEQMEAAGKWKRNQNARYVSPAYVVNKIPKPVDIMKDLRLTIDCREPNKLAQDGQWPMPVLEQVQEHLHGAQFFIGLDLKDGYFQCPLAEHCQELYSFATHRDVYTPQVVTQGSSGAVLYFQATMQKVFKELLYKNLIIWLDDLLLYGKSIMELYEAFRKVLQVCREIGFKLHAKKCNIFAQQIKWCGKIVTPTGISVDPERIQGLMDMETPETAGDLMKFLNASNWIRTSIPEYAQAAEPMQVKLKNVLHSKRKTKRIARGIKLVWNGTDLKEFNQLRDKIRKAVETAHPDPDAELLLMTDASDKGWSIVLMQSRNYNPALSIGDQDDLEPLYFLSGTFTGAARNWAINEKEAYPIMESLKRLRHLLLRPKGFRLFCDHRNLCFMFSEQPSLKLPTRSKLMRWAFELQSFRYTIEHIPGDQNLWADILSRWTTPIFKARKATKNKGRKRSRDRNRYSVKTPIVQPLKNFEWPDRETIAGSQTKHGRPPEADKYELRDGLWYLKNTTTVWIPIEDVELQTRLCIIAHYERGQHRGQNSTKTKLEKYCYWPGMKHSVREIVRDCLPCRLARTQSTFKRPWGEHEPPKTRNDLIHFDFIYMGPSQVGEKYLLVLKDGFSHFCELIPTDEPTAAVVVDALLQWIARFGIPKRFMSDRGSHFRNTVMQELARYLRIDHKFSTAYCAWSNGVAERINRDLLAFIRVMIADLGIAEDDWPHLIPLVQSGLNHSPAPSLQGYSPCEIFTALERSDALTLVFDGAEFVNLERTYEQAFGELQMKLTILETEVKKKKQRIMEQNQKTKSTVEFVPFELGDYVLYSRVDRGGRPTKLLTVWVGPMQIVDTVTDHVFVLRDLVSGDLIEAHTSRMDFYSDANMLVTGELKELVSKQGKVYDIDSIETLHWNDQKKRFELIVKWKGLSEFENSTESFIDFFKQVPVLCLKFLTSSMVDNSSLVDSLVKFHGPMLRRECLRRKLSYDAYPFLKKG